MGAVRHGTFPIAATGRIVSPFTLLLTVAGLVALAIAGSLPARAERAAKVYRLGLLSGGTFESGRPYRAALLERLQQLGYSVGSNLRIEFRGAGGDTLRLPALAKELVNANSDVIIAAGNPAVDAASKATRTIPIVMVTGDPVAVGFVRSLSRPDGNLTGVTTDTGVALWGKRLQLLKEAAPKSRRVAVLTRTGGAAGKQYFAELESAAQRLGLVLIHAGAKRSEDLPAAFATFGAQQPDALFVSETPLNLLERRAIIEFAVKHHLPDIHGYREAAEDGALMSYGLDLMEVYRQLASYVDRLFKGVKPADLPVEQPTKCELIINTKAAKALGLEIPRSLLLRADRLIE